MKQRLAPLQTNEPSILNEAAHLPRRPGSRLRQGEFWGVCVRGGEGSEQGRGNSSLVPRQKPRYWSEFARSRLSFFLHVAAEMPAGQPCACSCRISVVCAGDVDKRGHNVEGHAGLSHAPESCLQLPGVLSSLGFPRHVELAS